MRGLEGPDALGQPRLERQIVGEPAEQGLTEMNVGLNETRNDDEAVAVNLGRLRPSPTARDRPFAAPIFDCRDPTALYQDIGIQHPPLRVHRNNTSPREA